MRWCGDAVMILAPRAWELDAPSKLCTRTNDGVDQKPDAAPAIDGNRYWPTTYS